MKPTLLILAAGMGSRYGGLKQLDIVGPSSETIMDYAVFDAKRAGFGKVVFVIREELLSDFKKHVFSKYKGFIEVDYVFQELDKLPKQFDVPENRTKPWGTAHAVLVAKSKVKENFAVINADDFYGFSAYANMYRYLHNISLTSTNFALLTYPLINTISLNGSVSRGICQIATDKTLIKVVEHPTIYLKKDKLYSELHGKTIILDKDSPTSMNFMGFTPALFSYIETYFVSFLQANDRNSKNEFYLPALLTNLIKDKQAIVQTIPTNEQWFGVTYKQDKELVISKIQKKVNNGEYPKNLFQ